MSCAWRKTLAICQNHCLMTFSSLCSPFAAVRLSAASWQHLSLPFPLLMLAQQLLLAETDWPTTDTWRMARRPTRPTCLPGARQVRADNAAGGGGLGARGAGQPRLGAGVVARGRAPAPAGRAARPGTSPTAPLGTLDAQSIMMSCMPGWCRVRGALPGRASKAACLSGEAH